MQLIIIGSEGNVGRRLMKAFPGSIGIDRVATAAIVGDIAALDYDRPEVRAAFEKADGVIHVATSPNVEAADAVHWEAVVGAARLMEACDRFGIKRVVLPSSDWAEPKTRWAENEQNAYGRSKRIMEEMALMYNMTPGRMCVALRIGWVVHDPAIVEGAADWLKANIWDDERLIGQVKAALGVKS
jgi:nucleoside-diphosphate-sugar epimerase